MIMIVWATKAFLLVAMLSRVFSINSTVLKNVMVFPDPVSGIVQPEAIKVNITR
jgi:hypothetical protein